MKLIVLLSIFFVTACAHHVYVKPGATPQDWNRDNNDCLVKANQAGYRGGDVGSNIARNNFMDQCLSGQGWSKQTQESFNQQSAQVQGAQQQYKAKMDEFAQKRKDICAKDDYKVLIAKSPCNATDLVIEQLADESKINKKLKPVLLKFRSEMSGIDKETNAYVRSNAISPADIRWADYLESVTSDVEAYNLELYQGKLNWGEYNKKRKDNAAKIQTEWRNIFHPSGK